MEEHKITLRQIIRDFKVELLIIFTPMVFILIYALIVDFLKF